MPSAKCPDSILRLVERFNQHADTIRAPGYNETQIRIDFINPMFAALGWDMDNTQAFAEQYREVVHEDKVKVAGQTKAPDYSFRIGGQRKFFLEAKKPAVDIKNNWEPAYQLRRYAWSAKLGCSLLTDFEEFAIYDARIRPVAVVDKASTARREFIPYTDYESRWDFISGTFSKAAVLRGDFDKYCDTKKGRGVELFDDAFLAEIEDWRKSLASNLALRNESLDGPGLNFAVQRIIDRILFLRIAEDRGTETIAQLQSLLNGDHVYDRLKKLFRDADARYNSGIFHFQKEKDRDEAPDTLTPNLDIDDKALKQIIEALYYPKSPYEFTMVSADILGSVYERFLGKVITLTPGHRAKIEEKPEVRKAGGVYYTPTYIVDYIVKNTVGKLLEGKTPVEARKIKVLDPACGSGSFLIGAYQFLLDWYLAQYLSESPSPEGRGLGKGVSSPANSLITGKSAVLRPSASGSYVLTIAERKRVLLDHIHGVDLDSQAVEVTKLNLLLKCLEGETSQTLGFEAKLFKERALPDLGNNILCGNSLIGTDIVGTDAWKSTSDEEHQRINPFDCELAFPMVFKGKAKGFDVVIGNPPYGYMITKAEQDYFRRHYRHQDNQLDNYQLFVERCISRHIRLGGLFGMIIPNPWLTNLTQKSLRQFIVESTSLLQVVHFDFPVFPSVTVDTEVVILANSASEANQVRAIFAAGPEQLETGGCRTILHAQDKWRNFGGAVINLSVDSEAEGLAARIRERAPVQVDRVAALNVGIKPYQTGKGIPAQTAQTVKDRPFDSDHKRDNTFRFLLRGRDISRYRIVPTENRFLSYGPWLAEPRPAANFDAPIKIFMRQTGDSLIAAIDSDQRIGMNNLHVIVPQSGKWTAKRLIAFLNSRLLNWYYQTINPEKGEALAEVKRAHIAQLPLPDSQESAVARKMDSLVDAMLLLNERHSEEKTPQRREQLQREIDATDRQIDALVYQLYGLTEAEIKIVEEATKT